MAERATGKMENQNPGATHENGHSTETNQPTQSTQPVQPSARHPPQSSHQDPLPPQMLPAAGHGNVTGVVLETESDNYTGFQREHWTSNGEFIASVLAVSFDYGTFTVLPAWCSIEPVGFMIIYAAFYLFLGLPILYIDISLGQFSSRGPAHIWNLCPLFRGIGVGMIVYSAIYLPVYSLFSSWSLYYVAQSFSPTLPWSNCNNTWNTPACFNSTNAGVQYLQKRVLQVSESSGIDNMGGLQWELVGCCAGVTIVVFIALFWGLKVIEKVVCVTVSLMFVLTLALFVMAMTLPGTTDGLAYFFTPRFPTDVTKSPRVWLSAFLRAMYHVGMSSGVVNILASYRHFKSSALRDSVIICSISTAGRLLAGAMMMSLTVALANTKKWTIDAAVTSGIVSAFENIPELFPHLTVSQIWSFAYFFILLLVGLNQQGGVILMTLVDAYIIKLSIYILGILQFVTVGWVYGMGRLDRDIEMMAGIPPLIVIKFIWCFILPPVILIFLVLSFTDYTPPSYYSIHIGEILYPTWAHVMGWFIALAPLAPLPVFAVLAMVTSSQYLLRPRLEWGPAEVNYMRQYDSQRQYNVPLTERITSIFTN